MKKLLNQAQDAVKESLAGFAAAYSDLVKVHFAPNYIVRADAPMKGKVGIVSGGGSGHEPTSPRADVQTPGRLLERPALV